MLKIKTLFVNSLLDIKKLEEYTLYISMRKKTIVHLCPCGCGEKVFMLLAEDEWELIYDGSVTLIPSIGNFYFECESHYFIINDKIIPADKYTERLLMKRRFLSMKNKKIKKR